MGDIPPPFPRRPVTVEDLTYVLFGNPIVPQDKGIVGTMQDQIAVVQNQMKQLLRLAWALLIVFIGTLLSVSGDILIHHVSPP